MVAEAWQILMFGGLEAHCDPYHVSRFRTQKAAGIFAFLTYHSGRAHSRERLADQYWPDAGLDAGRNSLKQEIASLRRQFEPPGFASGSILITDRHQVRINAEGITTDVSQFEHLLDIGLNERDDARCRALLRQAVTLYRGELLPGQFEDWVLTERQRLALRYVAALEKLTSSYATAGETGLAIDAAQKALATDPFNEALQIAVVELCFTSGNLAGAAEQIRSYGRRLRDEMDEELPIGLQKLAVTITATTPEPANGPIQQMPMPMPKSVAPVRTTAPGNIPLVRLPLRMTRFFGREDELRQIPELLMGNWQSLGTEGVGTTPSTAPRLLTLFGPGGVGKTRLAMEVAELLAPRISNAVCFVQLAEITSADTLPSALCSALGISTAVGSDPLDEAIKGLSPGPSLLVLDNYEQLVDLGALFVSQLLQRLPQLICLVTSRRHLDITGEQLFPLSPLSSPVAPGSPARLMEFASVQLFVDRAQAVRPDFQLTPRNANHVASLCTRLEGIPLAIELAAAWSGTMTPAQILARLERRFELLVSRKRDTPERHRTLQAAIEGSYRILSRQQQRFFSRLGIFRGGWSLESAECIVAETGDDALNLLTELRERSLVLSYEAEGEMRFRMLETLRDFALDQMTAAEHEEIAQRHLYYFRKFARRGSLNLVGAEQSSWFNQYEQNNDNIRSALAWGKEHNTSDALLLAADMWIYWQERGLLQEGKSWLTSLLSLADAVGPTEPRARALYALSQLETTLGDYTAAVALINENLTIARTLNNRHAIAATLNSLANFNRILGNFSESKRLHGESLTIYQEISDRKGIAAVYNNQGVTAEHMGEFAAAADCYRSALQINREVGNRVWEAQNLSNIANIELFEGNHHQARELYESSLGIHTETGNRHGICDVLLYLAEATKTTGDTTTAREYVDRGITLAHELDDPIRRIGGLLCLAELECTSDNFAGAILLYRDCLERIRELQLKPLAARVLNCVATMLWRVGEKIAAVTIWGASEQLATPDASSLSKRTVEEDQLRSALKYGDKVFQEAWTRGQSKSLSACIQIAHSALDTVIAGDTTPSLTQLQLTTGC